MVLSVGALEKIPSDTTIDPGTVRLVAQCLNHYATPGPYKQYTTVMKGAKGEYLHMLTNAIHSATYLVSVSVLVRSRTIFKYNFRWLRWYSKT